VAAYVLPIFGDQLDLACEASLNILIFYGTTKATITLKLVATVEHLPTAVIHGLKYFLSPDFLQVNEFCPNMTTV
jgi:hypothetical protein